MRKMTFWIALLLLSAVVGGQEFDRHASWVTAGPVGLTISTSPGIERADLVVVGATGDRIERSFDAYHLATYDLTDESGQLLTDGSYTFEIREYTLVEEGESPVFTRSGTFELRGGVAYLAQNQADPGEEPDPVAGVGESGDLQTKQSAATLAGSSAVTGDFCVGAVSCDETMSFATNVGNGDLWILSTDPQLMFSDSSGTGDFSIEVNAGGFGIYDEDANRQVIGIGSAATANSLFVGDAGTVGVHTATPAGAIELHVFSASGNNAEIRLESGSSNREWDLESTGSSFWVQDVTAGTVPFLIENDVPDSMLHLDNTGRIGVGTPSPNATVEIRGSSGTAQLAVTEQGADASVEVMFNLICDCAPGFRMQNTVNGAVWFFRHTAAGDFSFDNVGSAGLEARLDSNGNFFIQGSLSQGSSRALKENLEPADGEKVLDVLTKLDLYEWSYIDEGARHFGPMAEEFSAAYGLGESKAKIAPADMAGLALAASKTLAEKNEALEAENKQLKRQLGSILERLEALEQQQ